MKRGYLFISNSTKPSEEQLECRDDIRLNYFSMPCIEAARDLGYELHMGINRNRPNELHAIGYDIKFYDSHTYRNIFAFGDIWTAYKNACKYIKENPSIKVIHCNTPIGGVIGRLCGRKFGCKTIYTAHGFHFFKGAPFFNRTILKMVERWLAHYTDVILTINQEDYEEAQRFRLKPGGKVFKVPGVGVDTSTYVPTKSREEIRASIGLNIDDFVCIGIGDVIKRKNFKTAIESIAETDGKVHYVICGLGSEIDALKDLAQKLRVEDRIHFLGFRRDIKDLLYASDAFLFSSLQEGLPRSTMEAMAAGLPCIVSEIRGNRDLIDANLGGYLIPPTDSGAFAAAIKKISSNPNLHKSMSLYNMKKIKCFDVKNVRSCIHKIYAKALQS